MDAPDPALDPALADTPAARALAGSTLRHELRPSGSPRSVEEAAAFQGVPVASILRTIVVRRATDDYLFVLVPGGRRIAWPRLRSLLGINRMTLPDADEAKAATGYERGTITPFGATRDWPIVADATLRGAGRVVLGGGRRGVTLHVDADELLAYTAATVADISDPAEPGED
ncbi:MAG: YbaK/EbsC family protein [Chloroflexota bacterium]